MKTKNLFALLLLLPVLAATALSACGGGGGGVTTTPITNPPQPTKAILKLSTAGSTILITTATVTITLPAGVTAKSTTAPPEIDAGIAFPSGNATSSELFIATYSEKSGTDPARVKALLGKASGFSNGEFMTIVFDLSPGASPTASDFIVELSVGDINGTAISGVTATKGVALQGSSTPTKARLKLASSGTTTTIGAIDMTFALPAGVTVTSTANPPETDPGVAFPSGQGIGSLMASTYTAASGTVRVAIMNASGFAAGEFATVMCDLAGGVRPVSSDFTVKSATVTGLYSLSSITGASTTMSVTLE
jgi:hypothetical protein